MATLTAAPATILAGIPTGLRTPLLDEFNKLVRNYRESRWEPAELNGGKFAEVVYAILRGHVDGAFAGAPAKPPNMVDACRALEQATGFPRSVRIHIPRTLLALYEVRNNRNVGHVGGDVDPNSMDASVVLAMSKWVMAELIRLFHNCSTDDATAAVEALTDKTIPLLWKVDGRMRVLGAGLSTRDKMMVLLYGLNEAASVRSVAEQIEYANVSRLRRQVVDDAHREDLVHFNKAADSVLITPVGIRYVEQHIPLEL